MILMAVLSATGFLIIVLKSIGLRKAIEYEVPLDVGFTIGIFLLCGGTLGGIQSAVMAGVIFSVMLLTLKLICGK